MLSPLLIIIFLFLTMLMFLQGGRAFALKIAHLKDLELRKFAADLPLRTFEANGSFDDGAYVTRVFSEIQGIVFTL